MPSDECFSTTVYESFSSSENKIANSTIINNDYTNVISYKKLKLNSKHFTNSESRKHRRTRN